MVQFKKRKERGYGAKFDPQPFKDGETKKKKQCVEIKRNVCTQ